MRRLVTIIGCEVYALLLAAYQLSVGVRTDEAKYLLDIPYPHPPLARFILSLLDGWAYQELFWRAVLATLVIQAVWLIIDLLKEKTVLVRIAGTACWLLSASVLLQAGTVMMVVFTALQALVLVWLYLRDRPAQPYLLALFWLASLFTAYQAVLFAPLVYAVFRRSKTGFVWTCILCLVPILLLALYTLTNPLVPASMLNQAGMNASETLLQHLLGTVRLWLLGGSVVLSIIGLIGLLVRPTFGLIGSFLLVAASVFIARYDYYALLFTPLLVAGAVSLLKADRLFPLVPITLMPLGLLFSLTCVSYNATSVVPHVYAAIDAHGGTGVVLINGSFGHEWQYGTSSIVERYHPLFTDEARAVICLSACSEMHQKIHWERLDNVPVEVWIP